MILTIRLSGIRGRADSRVCPAPLLYPISSIQRQFVIEFITNLCVAFFIIAWFYGIAWAITRGWRELAKYYRFSGIYTGNRYRFRTGSLAGANFGCFLIAGGNRQGAYFSTLLPSHLCPPLLIPWEDITGIERRGILSRTVELKLANDIKKSEVFNSISGRLADRLEKLSEGIWSYKHATRRVIFGKDENL